MLKRLRSSRLSFAACVLGATVLAIPAAAQSTPPTDDEVAAGKLVTTIAGCAACHTSEQDKPFAGGHVLHTPFGPMATPNITPDEATGIGSWTFDDFKATIHKGLNEDGAPLYPAMPYVHYTKMRDEDVQKIWTYLRTLEPINNEVDVNRLPFPFDVRQSLYVWRTLYFTEGRFQDDPNQSDAWNRGAYIVEALAHCGTCHTPRDALGGLITSRQFQGAQIENWYAPDISNGPNSVIADWDEARLTDFLSGESHLNHVALGSMRWVVDDLSQIPIEDVRAIATYLKSQRPAEDRSPAPPARVDAATRAAWAEVYAQNCVTCHAENGEGAPGQAASLVDAGGVIAAEPYNIISVMLEGIAPTGDYGLMPSFRDTLTDAEIAGAVNFVRSSWGNQAPTNATPRMVAWLRNQTEVAPGVMEGAVCPNVATENVPQNVRDMIKALAAAPSLDDTAVAQVAEAFRTARPNVNLTDTVVDLGGTYCRDVAETGLDRATVAQRNIAFWNALLQHTETQ